jgi:hypothetical protein
MARGKLAGVVVSFVVAAVVMTPILRAGFHPEDFGWLALARLSTSPWPLLTHNIDFVYFYRPVPMLVWWLSAHVFGTNAVAHNALDILLHAANAALVCLLAARIARRSDVGAVAGVMFAALPCGVGTAAWLSDRFDPIALMFSLLALLTLERALQLRRTTLWPGLFLLLALLSKEVAYATAAVMLLRLALRWWRDRDVTVDLFCVVLLAPIAGIGLRLLTGTAIDASLDVADPVHAFLLGVGGWWRQAPAALGGFLADPLLTGIVAILLLGAAIGVVMRTWRSSADALVLAGIGVGLLVLPAILQWPVTSLVLPDDGSRAFMVNLRFYYAAGAGFALVLAAGYATLRKPARSLLLAAYLVCASGACIVAQQVSARWAQDWAQQSDAYLVLGAQLGEREFPPGCRIYLDAPAWPEIFSVHADTIVKAVAAPNASVQACAIFAGEQVYQTIAPADRCAAAQWPGLALGERRGVPLAERIGDVCLLQFATTAPDRLGAPLFRFHVGGDGRAQEIRD